jgi:hypothetical protein
MAWTVSITDVLNQWDQMGVFAYVLPGLLIFALVFGIIEKSKILTENRGVNALVSLAVALLSLQFDFVSTFFAQIFPKAGIGLAIILILVILAGLFYSPGDRGERKLFLWIGIILAALIILWSFSDWSLWGGDFSVGEWFGNNFWAIIVLFLIIGGVIAVVSGGSNTPAPATETH